MPAAITAGEPTPVRAVGDLTAGPYCITCASMTVTPVTTFRISTELLAKLDTYAAELSRETGLRVSRNAAVVKLLTDGLTKVHGVADRTRPSSRASRR